jgi:hypothetical protein
MKKTVLLWYVFFPLIPLLLQSQNAPVTTAETVPGAVPGEITVSVTVVDFTNIGAVSLTVEYDYSVMHFIQGVPHPELSSCAIGDIDPGSGNHRIVMGWYGWGTSLPDGSVIMTLHFTFIDGITLLNWLDSGPSCEYADAEYNVLNDIPTGDYYINGNVCGAIGSPESINGPTAVCQGETGINYWIQPLENTTGYAWWVPPGAIIVEGNHTNSILVDFPDDAVSGIIGVNGINVCESGPVSELGVTVNALPVADAGNDTVISYGTCAFLNAASGDSGSFLYHWTPEELLIDPDVQAPQTVNMTQTTIFTLAVTSQPGQCQRFDEVTVTIIGGPLSCNPVSYPGEICYGSTSQLFANTGGGSGNYVYTWTCTPPDLPPWTSDQANPVVSPDYTKTYHLTVSDGFNAVTGSTLLTVNELSAASISGGDTLCGEGTSTLLTIDLSGTPPWSFYYSNGLTTWFVPELYTTPYTIAASEPGVYTILSLYDAHCTGTTSGSAEVIIFPIPPTPVVTQYGNQLFSSAYYGNQWYQDGVLIPGATAQSYEPAEVGFYFVIVTINGCASEPSDEIYFMFSGIDQPPISLFTIKPNPVTDIVTVKSRSAMPEILSIRIYTMEGMEVFSSDADTPINRIPLVVNIQFLPPGLYIMIIKTDIGIDAHKLIKTGSS